METIKQKESETVEFKESMSELESAGETLCGFTNQNGGIIYIGVKNNGELKGIPKITEKTIRDIAQYISDNFDPQKIVIKNPGGFPEGITILNIINETKPRNKLIADILFKCEFVEQFGNGVNLMYKNQLSLGKNPPNFNESTDKRIALELDGTIQDIEFAKYVLRVAESKKKILNDQELLILNKIKNNESIKSDGITNKLLELGLIERSGFSKYMLSKQYYEDTNQKGRYTKKRGLSKNKNKALILEHLKNFGSGKKEDFAQIFNYELNERQLWNLLDELKSDNKIYFDGPQRSKKGVWRLKK